MRRDPALQAAAEQALAHRRRRRRRRFVMLALGLALLGPAVWGYNRWVDVLAERRTIRVAHATSQGTENLPQELTADMTIATDGAANPHPRDSTTWCIVRVRWPDGGSAGVSPSPRRINVRGWLLSRGIRESPHYEHEPVTFQTEGCRPWRVETAG